MGIQGPPVVDSSIISTIVTISSLAVAALAIASSIMFQILAARRERNRIRYGIVYEEQFRVCKEIYTRLSRLRDSFEKYADIGAGDRPQLRPELDRRADAFRRSLRQNDVILPKSLATEISRVWDSFKTNIYDYDDAKDQTGEKLPSQARKDVLGAIDTARARLGPHIRRVYGID